MNSLPNRPRGVALKRCQRPSCRRRYWPRLEQLEDRSVPSVTLLTSSFFGGAGDQRGTGITFNNGQLFLSGNPQPESQGPGAAGLVVNYPTSLAAPTWSHTFAAGTNYFGIAATTEGVYPVGYNYSLSSDPVGGKEVKSMITKFNPDGSPGPGPFGSVWYRTPNIYGYSGVESYQAAATTVEGGNDVIYATGFGQPSSFAGFTVAKYDTAGNLLNAATDPNWPTPLSSVSNGITIQSGSVYLGGQSGYPVPQPAIWRYTSNLSYVFRSVNTSLAGVFNGITSDGSSLYAVGYRNIAGGGPSTYDYLIEKFDAAGNSQWTTVVGGANEDNLTGVVALNGKIYAVGYTRSAGAGGKDLVVLEIDPVNGNILSTTYFGGAQDDQANGITTDGTSLYVVGESRSFASGGNSVGQNDIVTLKYSIAGFGLQADPLYGGNMLLGNATGGADILVFNRLTAAGGLAVYMNGTMTQYPATVPISRIVVYGGDGNDYLWGGSSITVPFWLFGQGGDDKISGGAGHDVLVGGAGNDLLTGNGGNDVMIGGIGIDRLTGGAGDDLLIGAFTSYDANEMALKGVLDEWSSVNAYGTRVSNVRSGGGMTGGYLLQDGVTVFDDNAQDDLIGMTGTDWYFAYLGADLTRPKDRLGDLDTATEIVDLLT